MSNKKTILIQIGCMIVIIGMFGVMLPLFAHTCEDDYSTCDLFGDPPLCPLDGPSCEDTCTSGSRCYYNQGSPACTVSLLEGCTCSYDDKDETKEDCDNYFEEEGSFCHFEATDTCTTNGWGCEATASCDLGGCCECTAVEGCVPGPDALCPLRYCGGDLELGPCACQGCNLNATGDQFLNFHCELNGTHHLQIGNLTINLGGSITMLAGSTFKFDNGWSIIMNGGYIAMSQSNVTIEKQYH